MGSIFSQLLSQESNPGIEFEYSMPKGIVQETPPAGVGYAWFPEGSWSECSAPCGGGTRGRSIKCKRTDSLEITPGH